LDDKIALTFTKEFYKRIFAGESVCSAFNAAQAFVMFEMKEKHDGVEKQVRIIKLVTKEKNKKDH